MQNSTSMSFWDRLDKVLTRVEKKGFNAANKAHVWTINLILAGVAYGTYTIFRDYNEFFLAGRVTPLQCNVLLTSLLRTPTTV